MKSKKPFFSRELVFNNLRRFWWIAVLFTLALFLVSPLIALTNGSDTIPKSGYNIYFSDIFSGTLIFLITIPVFIGVMMFRYMQNSKSMVAMHAMPYTRLRLYFNNIISGLILILMPILLNYAFLSVIQLGNLGGTYFKEGIVLRGLWISILTSVTLYVWTIFIGMFTGSSVAQVIFTYISNFLLVGLVMVCQYLLSGILYGFVMNEEICMEFLKISPLAQLMLFMDNSMKSPEIWNLVIIDFVICVVGLVVGYYIYKYRNLETAGDVISGKYVKPVFKYGVTTCFMLVGALYVREIFSMDTVNVFVYLLFGLLGYIIAEMLLRKSFKIFDSYKGFIYFTIVFLIVSFGLKLDLFGYEKYIPDINGVKAAALNIHVNFDKSTPENPGYGIMYEQANIENIINLHKNVVDDKNINLTKDWNLGDTVYISYLLNDGSVVKREYYFERGRYDELINKVYDSSEYKKATNNIFDYTVDDIYSARISNILIDDVYVSIDNKQELNELFEAMKMDILDTTTAESAEYRNIYRVELTVKPKKDSEVTTAEYKSTVILVETEQVASFISKSFNKNAKNVNSFINSRGYDKILKNSSDVISISLHYNDKDDVVKTVKDSEKIDRIMAILYDTDEGNYTRYGENFSVEIKHGNGRSWLDVSKENGDSIIRIFEE